VSGKDKTFHFDTARATLSLLSWEYKAVRVQNRARVSNVWD